MRSASLTLLVQCLARELVDNVTSDYKVDVVIEVLSLAS